MKKGLFTVMLVIGTVSSGYAYAQQVSDYLEDKADTALRVEVSFPEDQEVQKTWWQKLISLIGVRVANTYKPPAGTSFVVQSSAYAPSPYQTDATPCVTAAGTKVRNGVVASNFLPLGTILSINEKPYIVEDRMNPRYNGYYLDIWFPSTSSALDFGRKKLVVTVVGYGKPGDPLVLPTATPVPYKDVLTGDQKLDTPYEQSRADVKLKLNPIEGENEVWQNIKSNLNFFNTLLPARNPETVDQYDVDCLQSE